LELLQYSLRKLLYGIPLILGVTFISFVLMVYFGPDKTYDLLGKNPTPEQIAEVRHQLGYDRPFISRYTIYLKELITLELGYSDSTGERVSRVLKRTIPISLALVTPGFILGNLLGIVLALVAAYHRGNWLDKTIMSGSVIGMSISYLIVIIAFQIIFSTPYGLNLFPVRGWESLLCHRTHAGHRVRGAGVQHPLLPGRHSRGDVP
jgi:peptide/nickel transport system permease protein